MLNQSKLMNELNSSCLMDVLMSKSHIDNLDRGHYSQLVEKKKRKVYTIDISSYERVYS